MRGAESQTQHTPAQFEQCPVPPTSPPAPATRRWRRKSWQICSPSLRATTSTRSSLLPRPPARRAGLAFPTMSRRSPDSRNTLASACPTRDRGVATQRRRAAGTVRSARAQQPCPLAGRHRNCPHHRARQTHGSPAPSHIRTPLTIPFPLASSVSGVQSPSAADARMAGRRLRGPTHARIPAARASPTRDAVKAQACARDAANTTAPSRIVPLRFVYAGARPLGAVYASGCLVVGTRTVAATCRIRGMVTRLVVVVAVS